MSIYPIILAQDEFPHRDAHYPSSNDRGIQFGDGIYEVVRIYQGDYYLLDEHIERLFRSAEAIQLTLPFTKQAITNNLLKLVTLNQMQDDGKLYLQVTRGTAPRSHLFSDDLVPNVYGYLRHLPRNITALTEGVSVITHPDLRWEYCYIKSLNLLPNILAKQEAHKNNCFEAVLHKDNIVTEGSSSNIFLVKHDQIYTFPPTHEILHGCIRAQVKVFAEKLSIPFFEEKFMTSDLIEADEIFLTSTTSEILPVVTVDQKAIHDGKRGPITKMLQTMYEKDANIHP